MKIVGGKLIAAAPVDAGTSQTIIENRVQGRLAMSVGYLTPGVMESLLEQMEPFKLTTRER